MIRRSGLYTTIVAAALASCDNNVTSTQQETLSTSAHMPTALARKGLSTASAQDAGLRSVARVAKTSPGSACLLHGPGTANGSAGLHLFADDNGTIRFYLSASSAQLSDPANSPLIDCKTPDGTILPTQVIGSFASAQLALDAEAEEMALPVQPPLTGDPLGYSQKQLVALGQPPRPDPDKAPQQFAKWREIVSIPKRLVSSKTVENPDIVMATYHDSWSGVVTHQPPDGSKYDWIQGNWEVPDVTNPPGHTGLAIASIWVGLDGAPGGTSSDVAQAGTDQEVLYFLGITAYTYNAWIQWLPGPSHVTSLVVHAEDTIYTEVWVGDVDGSYDVAGGYCWAYIYNVTSGLLWENYVTRPSGTSFKGDAAEWILERPSICTNGSCSTAYLANYGYTWMDNFLAYSDSGLYLDINEPFSQDYWMKSSSTGNLLTQFNRYGASTLGFYWDGSH